MLNLFGMTYDQLHKIFKGRYRRGHYHASALYRAFYRTPRLVLDDIDEFRASPALMDQIRKDLDLSLPQITGRQASGGVTKLAFALDDGLQIETVVIPMANHATVCVSSQVGCRMGCRFCRTGAMGLRRQLSAAEIVSQVHAVRQQLGVPVRNVVFMGMGEPLDNFDAVTRAIAVMSDQRGLNIAKRRITLSTVGLVHGLDALGGLGWHHLRLAISINASNDIIRETLMPINRRFAMRDLKHALLRYPLADGDTFFIEYVLIRGLNDHPEHARQLGRFLRGLPVKLNLIPYNPGKHAEFEAPRPDDLDRFHQALIHMGLFVRVRDSKGRSIRAACGQLGNAGRLNPCLIHQC